MRAFLEHKAHDQEIAIIILMDEMHFHGIVLPSYCVLAGAMEVELFQVANDPGEADNVANDYPDRVDAMMQRLNEYAYDMAPAKFLGEPGADNQPVFWRENRPAR